SRHSSAHVPATPTAVRLVQTAAADHGTSARTSTAAVTPPAHAPRRRSRMTSATRRTGPKPIHRPAANSGTSANSHNGESTSNSTSAPATSGTSTGAAAKYTTA